jgi:hypothetical protein
VETSERKPYEHPIPKAGTDMSGIHRTARVASVLGLLLASGQWFESVARGQGAVAYQPVIGFIPEGATLNVTPVVSADRRYIRLSMNPYFISLNGFTTYQSQLAAVGGVGFAGMNGAMGGGAGGGGGAGVGGAGMGAGGPFGQFGRPNTGTYAAGDYPFAPVGIAQGFPQSGFPASRDAFDQASGDAPLGVGDDFAEAAPFPQNPRGISEAPPARSVRATPRSKSARRQAARKPSRTASKTKAPRR